MKVGRIKSEQRTKMSVESEQVSQWTLMMWWMLVGSTGGRGKKERRQNIGHIKLIYFIKGDYMPILNLQLVLLPSSGQKKSTSTANH